MSGEPRAQVPAQISADHAVEAILDCWPAAAQVFVRRRMHCVGCEMGRFDTVADACRIYDQPLDAVLAELRQVARATQPHDDTASPHMNAS